MFGRLPISLLSALAWSSLSSAAVLADPTITSPASLPKRQNDAAYIGWLSDQGAWSSQECNAGNTWSQGETYAQCCPTTAASCRAPTACLSGTLIYPASSGEFADESVACTDAYNVATYTECASAFIFENFSDSNPKTDIICADTISQLSYYRTIPATASEGASSLTSESTASATDDSQPISSTTPKTSQSKKKKKKKSKAGLISGAVVGPVVGLLLIGAIALLLLHRNKKNKQPQPEPVTVGGAPPMQEASGPQQGFAQQGAYAPPAQSPAYNQQPQQQQQQQQPQQQAYAPSPISPVPQYNTPYQAPGSPPPQETYPTSPPQQNSYSTSPPQQNAFGSDQKYSHNQSPNPGPVSELGSSNAHAPAPQATELEGNSAPASGPPGQGLFR